MKYVIADRIAMDTANVHLVGHGDNYTFFRFSQGRGRVFGVRNSVFGVDDGH